MARTRIPITVIDLEGDAVTGASVRVKYRSTGTDATVYTAETGGTSTANPQTTDSYGRVSGWVEAGAYVADVSGSGLTPYSVPFESNPATTLLDIQSGLVVANYLDLDAAFEGNTTAVGTGAWTNVGSGTALVNKSSQLDASTGIWTCPVNGTYLVVGWAQLSTPTANVGFAVSALQSPAAIVRTLMWQANVSATSTPSAAGFWLGALLAGATLTFRYLHTDGVSRTLAWRYLVFNVNN